MIPPFRREFDAAIDPATAHYALNLGKAATWTPTLTFATPGDLSVSYAARTGTIIAIGPLRIVTFGVQTSAFTHTTAAGNLGLTGLTLAPVTGINFVGTMTWGGITKATYTQIAPRLNASTTINFNASGSGVANASVTAADTPTGGTVLLRGTIIYSIS